MKLLITDRKVLRRIFGPTKNRDDTQRNKRDKLNNLSRNKNIIKYTKAQRLSWLGHIQRMANDRVLKNYMSGNRYLQVWQEDQSYMGKKCIIGQYASC
jgi:hypothetical protein